MEHEDCVGGLLHGGPLAEGHREEPGGGGGERPRGSSDPNPGLLSQGCSPLQGQLSQVALLLHVDSYTILLFSDKARTFSPCALVQGKNTVIVFSPPYLQADIWETQRQTKYWHENISLPEICKVIFGIDMLD